MKMGSSGDTASQSASVANSSKFFIQNISKAADLYDPYSQTILAKT